MGVAYKTILPEDTQTRVMSMFLDHHMSLTDIAKSTGYSRGAVSRFIHIVGQNLITVCRSKEPVATEDDEIIGAGEVALWRKRCVDADKLFQYTLQMAFESGLERRPSASAACDTGGSLAGRRHYAPVPQYSGCSSSAALCTEIA